MSGSNKVMHITANKSLINTAQNATIGTEDETPINTYIYTHTIKIYIYTTRLKIRRVVINL